MVHINVYILNSDCMLHRENSLLRTDMFLKESLSTMRWRQTTWTETKLPLLGLVKQQSTVLCHQGNNYWCYTLKSSPTRADIIVSSPRLIYLRTRHGSKHWMSSGENPWEKSRHRAQRGQEPLHTSTLSTSPHVLVVYPDMWVVCDRWSVWCWGRPESWGPSIVSTADWAMPPPQITASWCPACSCGACSKTATSTITASLSHRSTISSEVTSHSD